MWWFQGGAAAPLFLEATDRHLIIGWSELEVPALASSREAVIGWSEFEVPDTPNTAIIGWSEFEVPDLPVGPLPVSEALSEAAEAAAGLSVVEDDITRPYVQALASALSKAAEALRQEGI